ncbi:MAG: hypothetical protein NC483_01520 [Ruminococcus sp.]|nr:hypothetical protein [Ruminococcus sp.]
MNQTKWYKLDNAAKIFPPTTTYYDPKIFRFSVILSENINKNNLEKALNLTLNEFPIFNSVLKKGIFWYYLEQSLITPHVHVENTSPCEKLNTPLLFEVTYYKNKINLEVYHALSDGSGCISFFRVLIYNYLNINYNLNDEIDLITSSKNEKETNSFEKYYNPKEKIKITKKPLSYQLKGSWYPEGKLKIICGVTNTSDIKDIAHKYNTTITGFLIALIIKSLENMMSIKDKAKPISITVPIDLRKFFNSETVRNFFNVTNINYKFTKDNTPLEEIIKSVDKDLKDSLKPEVINSKMNKMIYLEHFFIVRLIPLFIKNIILKISYKLTRKKQTMGLSNVGIIDLPKSCAKYIKDFLIFNSTDALELCICSYNNKISFNFSSHFKSSELEKNFFRLLKEYNLNISIYTNEIEGCENYE